MNHDNMEDDAEIEIRKQQKLEDDQPILIPNERIDES